MCGRFDVDAANREIDQLLASLPPGSPPPRLGEVYPTANALTLVAGDTGPLPRVMTWGFPRHNGKGAIFNARCETAVKNYMFRSALRDNPLAVPISGFYEWHSEDRRKIKIRFSDPDSAIFYLAGFWRNFSDTSFPPHFTVLTTEANSSVRPWHHRMPILLRRSRLEGWLSGENRENILHEVPFDVAATICQTPPEAPRLF